MIKILMAALITFSATDGFTGRDRVTHERGHLHKGGRYSKRHTAYPVLPNTDLIAPQLKASNSQRSSTPHQKIQQPPQTTTPSVTTAPESVAVKAAPPAATAQVRTPKTFDRARKKKPWDVGRHAARDDKYARQHEDDFETDRSIFVATIDAEIHSLEKRAGELEGQIAALYKQLDALYAQRDDL